jgi:hypothetical protein
MNLTPFLHTPTGLTVYMQSDPSVADFRVTGASFEARVAPFDEDKPKLKAALRETKRLLQDKHDAKLALLQARIDAL